MRRISFVRTGVAAFTAAALGALVLAPSPAYAAPVMTLGNATGPAGGGNVVTGTLSGGWNGPVFPAGIFPTVQFQYFNGMYSPACRTNPAPNAQIVGSGTTSTDGVLTVNPEDVRRISPTKLAFTAPSSPYPATVNGSPSSINTSGLSLPQGQTLAKWNVCVYDGDSPSTSTLLATAIYTIAQRPRITAINPASSPAAGGQTITVTGNGFGAGTTATIDGLSLRNINLAADGTSFTGSTPPHVQGSGYPLIVKTSGGLLRSVDPDNNGLPEDADAGTPDAPILFTFDNSIGVSPTAALAGSTNYLDIHGEGFNDLTFDPSAAPTDPTAHVFLVQNTYQAGANRGVQECGEVIIIDDTELICTLDLAADSLDPYYSSPQSGVPVAAGDYNIAVVPDGSFGYGGDSSAAAFTVI